MRFRPIKTRLVTVSRIETGGKGERQYAPTVLPVTFQAKCAGEWYHEVDRLAAHNDGL
jgi:hypothetical protein